MHDIRFKRGTAVVLARRNPLLLSGEPVYELGTGRMKIGDGVRRWNELPYYVPEETNTIPQPTPTTPTSPQPSLDDMPSLALLFENGLV